MTVKFADAMKAMLRSMLSAMGYDPHTIERMIEGDLKEEVIPEIGVSPRHLMQTLGTDWGRNLINPDVWVQIAMARTQRLLAEGKRVVLDDMRFPNEYAAIDALPHSMLLSVARPGHYPRDGHPSEGLLNFHGFHFNIENDAGLLELKLAVRGIMAHVRFNGIPA